MSIGGGFCEQKGTFLWILTHSPGARLRKALTDKGLEGEERENRHSFLRKEAVCGPEKRGCGARKSRRFADALQDIRQIANRFSAGLGKEECFGRGGAEGEESCVSKF